jgi:hypothetical protein
VPTIGATTSTGAKVARVGATMGFPELGDEEEPVIQSPQSAARIRRLVLGQAAR